MFVSTVGTFKTLQSAATDSIDIDTGIGIDIDRYIDIDTYG